MSAWASRGDCRSTSPRSLENSAQSPDAYTHYSPVMIAALSKTAGRSAFDEGGPFFLRGQTVGLKFTPGCISFLDGTLLLTRSKTWGLAAHTVARLAPPRLAWLGTSMTTEGIAPLSQVEHDALCELANVAMARAATSMRRMVGRQILLTVPTCEILAPEGALDRVVKPGNSNLVAVRQDFSGVFSGRALLIFPEIGSLELMRASSADSFGPKTFSILKMRRWQKPVISFSTVGWRRSPTC